MAHHSKREAKTGPAAPPAYPAGEFVAPAGAIRRRGVTSGSRDPGRPAPEPARVAGEGGAPAGSRSAPARDELKLCGLAAVRARFARDPGSIQRLFFDHATGQRVGVMCRVLAAARKIYRQVEPAELERISGSIHHGGIVAVVTPLPLRMPTPENLAAWAGRGEALLVLDRIGNAHNLGAIARTAAFFGVPRIVIPETAAAARPTDAAHRVAEGGFEHLEVWQVPDLVTLAGQLKAAGYDVVGAATRGGRADGPRAKERRPLALFLGNEEQGLAPEVAAACARLVTIPGSGRVESLNVSVAAAVLMWELLARRGQ
jgi:TrmH RNA methyltransferase